MNNRFQFFTLLIAVAFVIGFGCSGGNGSPVIPDAENVPDLTPAPDHPAQSANTHLLGYYDIYYDFAENTFEAVEDRTAAFTLNIVPFLNQMTVPMNGITFGSIIIHDDDPTFLGVDVEFTVHHPFPGIQQYDAYDLIGVIIGDGAHLMEYNGLRTGEHGTDLWMKNPDGYTRWFNPSEFTTELIFGWAPGGWQNLKGDATLNPYKYYSKHLGKDDDLWNYLTGDNNWDGFFESGSGRTMELEFPLFPQGIGLKFGYAIVVEWEEQGPTGPYYPVHRMEALAASATQTPDVWYDASDGSSGGNLILDIDLFAWEYQPSTVTIESSMLSGLETLDFETDASPGGEYYSTWHVDIPAAPLNNGDSHDVWIIAEYEAHDYDNDLPEIPHPPDPCHAVFRYSADVSSGPQLKPPLACATIETAPPFCTGDPVEFSGLCSEDQDEGGDSIVMYEWDFNGDGFFGDPYDSGTDDNPTKIFTSAGTYNVDLRVTDDEGETDTLDEFLVIVISSPPEISDIVPDSGLIDTIVPAVLTGDYFDSSSQVSLVKNDDDTVVIYADNVVVTGSTQIDCDFDLSGADPVNAEQGTYHVVVTNSSCESQLTDGFEITIPFTDPIWWENHKYNTEQSGYNPTAATPDPTDMVSLWLTPAPNGSANRSHCTPIVAGDKIFFVSYTGWYAYSSIPYLYCYDLLTGDYRFHATTALSPGGRISSGLAYYKDTSGNEYIVIGSDKIYCFDATSLGPKTISDALWTYDDDTAIPDYVHWASTPFVISNGNLVARGSNKAALYVIDVTDGSLVFDPPVTLTGAGESGLAVSDGIAYIYSKANYTTYFEAVDLTTGNVEFSEDIFYDTSHWNTPCIDGTRAYLACFPTTSGTTHLLCYALDGESGYSAGDQIWDWALPINGIPVGGPTKFGDDIFVVSANYASQVCAVTDNGSYASNKWQAVTGYFDATCTVMANSSYPDGLVVVPLRNNGQIYFLDTNNGSQVHMIDTPDGFSRSGISFVDEYMVFVGGDYLITFWDDPDD